MVMYSVGELVVRANEGVCRVSEIGHPDFQNPEEELLYYILIPVKNTKIKIYMPTEPEPVGLRRLIGKDEALELIRNWQEIPSIEIANLKLREQQLKQVLRSNDIYQLASVIRTLYIRERIRTEQGKKPGNLEKRYFQRAEELLYSELAMVLDVEESSIPDRIRATDAEGNPV